MDVKLIFGPPGTGKTTKLMEIIEDELKTVKPSEIAFVTFTKQGAIEGIRRACKKFNYKQKEFPYFRTLHSLAFTELKLHRSNVMGPQHYRHFSKKMGMNFIGYYTEELTNDDDKYLFFDHLHRNNPRYASKQIDQFDVDKLHFVRANYKKYKDFFALYDYTDMIEMYNKAEKSVPVKVAIIDEAQDLTTLQWQMVWRAFKDAERVYIAGDDDQGIYQWSGADVEYFMGVKGEPTVLRHSWRLPDSILDFSKQITGQMTKRVPKQFTGTGGDGYVNIVNSLDEIGLNPNESYMFLSRNNCFMKQIEEFVQRKGLIYRIKDKASITDEDFKALRMYEQVRKDRHMDDAMGYTLLPYLRKPVNLAWPWYEAFAWTEEKCNYVRDIIKNKTDIHKCNVYIGTIHSVKGGECDNVVMLLDITKSVKNNLDVNPDSEHRVFYVGATRAKKTLTIVNSTSKFEYPLYKESI